jgi:hypothetical protein
MVLAYLLLELNLMKVDLDKISRTEESGGKRSAIARPATIRGIVLPVVWDERGNGVDFAILTHDEDEYRIAKNKKGRDLMAYVRKEVEVSGLVSQERNRKRISVKGYSLKRASE